MSYTGKMVFLERLNEKGEPDYESGEWYCVYDSGATLYCLKPYGTAYDYYAQKFFGYVGHNPWTVLRAMEPNGVLLRLNLEGAALECAAAVAPGATPKWSGQVYAGARTAIEAVRAMLDGPAPKWSRAVQLAVKTTSLLIGAKGELGMHVRGDPGTKITITVADSATVEYQQ